MTPDLSLEEITAHVKKELQDEAMNARKEQELAKIDEQLEQIKQDSNLKDAEREMHTRFLEFNRKKTELMFTDLDKAKVFEAFEKEYNEKIDLNLIRINPQGDAVVELRVPAEKLDNLDELIAASATYWSDLSVELDNIISDETLPADIEEEKKK